MRVGVFANNHNLANMYVFADICCKGCSTHFPSPSMRISSLAHNQLSFIAASAFDNIHADAVVTLSPGNSAVNAAPCAFPGSEAYVPLGGRYCAGLLPDGCSMADPSRELTACTGSAGSELYLTARQITGVAASAFISLDPSVSLLDLSGNQVSALPSGVFSPLASSLQFLCVGPRRVAWAKYSRSPQPAAATSPATASRRLSTEFLRTFLV